MKIEITPDGIRPNDLFSITDRRLRYLAMDNNGIWHLFITEPKYSGGKWKSISDSLEIPHFIKVDYSDLAENSLLDRKGRVSPSMFVPTVGGRCTW